jgi:hypothetical protein
VERDGPRPAAGEEPTAPRHPRLSPREKVIRAFTLSAGAGIGAALGLPFTEVDASRCPPALGEGLNQCLLQKGYAPALTVFVACVVAALMLVDVARRTPAFVRRRRDPQFRLARKRKPPTAEAHDDPILLAASWGGGK